MSFGLVLAPVPPPITPPTTSPNGTADEADRRTGGRTGGCTALHAVRLAGATCGRQNDRPNHGKFAGQVHGLHPRMDVRCCWAPGPVSGNTGIGDGREQSMYLIQTTW